MCYEIILGKTPAPATSGQKQPNPITDVDWSLDTTGAQKAGQFYTTNLTRKWTPRRTCFLMFTLELSSQATEIGQIQSCACAI